MRKNSAWKKARGIETISDMCRLCGKYKESVDHLLAGCEKLAGSAYLKRHNNALMVLAVEWAKKNGLLDRDVKWYELSWQKGTVLEKDGKKLIWDFEFKMRKKTSARRPDLVLEDSNKKMIYILDVMSHGRKY